MDVIIRLSKTMDTQRIFNDKAFLYARIQTGRIMVWWCLTVRPSVTVFRTFLLHTLTYWAEILYVTFFLWTFDQVRVSSISVNFCWSYAPFGT